jgi:16S rRNA (guanine527-N7)-methyltransferase
MLSTIQIIDQLALYGIEVTPELADKISAYTELLLRWNRKIALTTVTDPVEIVKFHFGESLFALSTGACGKSRLADVGTGAGFPGLPLAIADSSFAVTLIESNHKKCAFLSEVIRKLAISNATVMPVRMESVEPRQPGFQWIAARALGHFDALLDWAGRSLSQNGRVILWLGESDVRELSDYPNWTWDAPVLIPDSSRRFILKGSPKTAGI